MVTENGIQVTYYFILFFLYFISNSQLLFIEIWLKTIIFDVIFCWKFQILLKYSVDIAHHLVFFHLLKNIDYFINGPTKRKNSSKLIHLFRKMSLFKYENFLNNYIIKVNALQRQKKNEINFFPTEFQSVGKI